MIHIYHGDGKGKTTAALGLALRASGAGLRVAVLQFLKGRDSSELALLETLPGVTLLRGQSGEKFSWQMDERERAAALCAHQALLERGAALLLGGQCDLLILDEALGALSTGLLPQAAVRGLLEEAPEGAELVFTGRNPPDFLLEAADYVTEMKCGKHPYQRGVAARKGIEF